MIPWWLWVLVPCCALLAGWKLAVKDVPRRGDPLILHLAAAVAFVIMLWWIFAGSVGS